jgi:hypothetical protein
MAREPWPSASRVYYLKGALIQIQLLTSVSQAGDRIEGRA